MQKLAIESIDPSVNACRLMWSNAVPIAFVLAVESHLVVWIPSRMPDPTPHIPCPTGDLVTVGQVVIRLILERKHGFAQFGCNALVGIYPEYPELRESVLSLKNKPDDD